MLTLRHFAAVAAAAAADCAGVGAVGGDAVGAGAAAAGCCCTRALKPSAQRWPSVAGAGPGGNP